jgi:hypothetical protein
MSEHPRLADVDTIVRALDGLLATDLRSLRVAALAFESVVLGNGRFVVAQAIDDEGNKHLLGVRNAARRTPSLYVRLFSELLMRGLRAQAPLLVDVDGCPRLAERVRAAFGERVRIEGG